MSVAKIGVYAVIPDYYPTRHMRRWAFRVISTAESDGHGSRTYRYFTHAGMHRARARFERRGARALARGW